MMVTMMMIMWKRRIREGGGNEKYNEISFWISIHPRPSTFLEKKVLVNLIVFLILSHPYLSVRHFLFYFYGLLILYLQYILLSFSSSAYVCVCNSFSLFLHLSLSVCISLLLSLCLSQNLNAIKKKKTQRENKQKINTF